LLSRVGGLRPTTDVSMVESANTNTDTPTAMIVYTANMTDQYCWSKQLGLGTSPQVLNIVTGPLLAVSGTYNLWHHSDDIFLDDAIRRPCAAAGLYVVSCLHKYEIWNHTWCVAAVAASQRLN